MAAAALRLQRACGLRIGELLDLELDCVHEITEHGSWLKIPLGKLDRERMVPIDSKILDLVDHIIDLRSHGRPMPHPRYRRPAQFVFTHHGRRLSQNAVRAELDRAAHFAGLDHITPHQLRHTYATAMEVRGIAFDASFDGFGDRDLVRDLGFRVLPPVGDCWADTLPDLRCDRAGCICCHDEASGFVASVASLWRPMPAAGRETA